jgi:peptidoglycan/xylan/chitin deacetylase (PgdA/CDA1 family)
MSIASHSRTHNILNTIINEEELQNEIIESKKAIEERTKQMVNVFTCPNGIYNEKVISIVEAAQYQYMFTTEEHKTKQSSILNQKLNMLPRISVNKSTFEENIFKINNFFSMARPLSK